MEININILVNNRAIKSKLLACLHHSAFNSELSRPLLVADSEGYPENPDLVSHSVLSYNITFILSKTD